MSDLVDRLRGKYRIPITDGLGAAGGEEPENELEFVRTFPSPPIQVEAASEIERLRAALVQINQNCTAVMVPAFVIEAITTEALSHSKEHKPDV